MSAGPTAKFLLLGMNFSSAEFCDFLFRCSNIQKFTTAHCLTSYEATERCQPNINNFVKMEVKNFKIFIQIVSRSLIIYTYM